LLVKELDYFGVEHAKHSEIIGWDKVDRIGSVETLIIQSELASFRNIWIDDLGLLKLGIIVDRILDLVPLITPWLASAGSTGHQPPLESLQMLPYGRV